MFENGRDCFDRLTIDHDDMIDDIYDLLIELTNGEEDKELKEYYEYVISHCEEIREYLKITRRNNKQLKQQLQELKQQQQ